MKRLLILLTLTFELFASAATTVTPSPDVLARTNTAWVRGTAFQNLTLAKKFSTNGDLVVVGPGTYVVTNSLAKSNVNWWLSPGCTIAMTNYFVTNGGPTARSIFDDIDGAVSFSVGGYGDLSYNAGKQGYNSTYFTNEPWNQLIYGGVYLQNSNSTVNLRCRNIYIQAHSDDATPPAAVWIANCKQFTLECESLIDPYFAQQIRIGTDEFSDPVNQGSSTGGLWWELGEMHVNVKVMTINSYPIYLNQPAGSNHVANFWLKANSLTNAGSGACIYTAGSGTSPRWKSWIEVEEAGGPSAVAGAAYYAGGLHYLKAHKVWSGTGYGIQFSTCPGGIYFWGDVLKVQSATSAGIKTESSVATNSLIDLRVQHISDAGAMTAGVQVDAGTVSIEGTRFGLTNAFGVAAVLRGVAKLTIRNSQIDSFGGTSTNNAITVVTNNNLVVANSVIVGPTNKFGILSMTTNSARVYNSVVNNPSTNMSFTDLGTFKTNALVR